MGFLGWPLTWLETGSLKKQALFCGSCGLELAGGNLCTNNQLQSDVLNTWIEKERTVTSRKEEHALLRW